MYFFNLYWKKRVLNQLGDERLIKKLLPNVSHKLATLKFILYAISLLFLFVGLANLQFGTKLQEVKREGVDLMICLDVSNSMMAEDITPNRLERSKRAIYQLIDKLHNDRIGIIVFAGEAYVQLPITTDYSSAKLFLETIGTDMIPTQGTSIGSAIDLAMESFNFKDGTSKAIIVITDGENHEENAIENTEKAEKKGITIHTIGMGSKNGSPIPIYRNGKQIGFKTDKEGNTVVSKLNEAMLKQIASTGNGSYVRASNANAGLNIIMNEINKMDKKEFGSKVFKDYEDRFQVFLIISLILLVLEYFISNRKSSKLDKINLFETKHK